MAMVTDPQEVGDALSFIVSGIKEIKVDYCEIVVKMGFGIYHSAIFKDEKNKAISEQIKTYLLERTEQVQEIVANSTELVKKNFEAWK